MRWFPDFSLSLSLCSLPSPVFMDILLSLLVRNILIYFRFTQCHHSSMLSHCIPEHLPVMSSCTTTIGCSAEWLQCGVAAVWSGCSVEWLQCGVAAVWSGCSVEWLQCGVAAVWSGCSVEWLHQTTSALPAPPQPLFLLVRPLTVSSISSNLVASSICRAISHFRATVTTKFYIGMQPPPLLLTPTTIINTHFLKSNRVG